MEINLLIITLLFSFVLSVFVTPWLVRLCLRMDWTDIPNYRKIHTKPIPRLGGLVFLPCAAISFSISWLVFNFWMKDDTTIQFSTICMVVGAFTIYMVGLVDDIHELRANTKFLIQLAAALIFPLCNLLISDLHGFLGIHEMPFILSYPLTVFIILLITNSMNLIDGIDGLASGLSILILSIFMYLFMVKGELSFALIASATLGSVIGFFCYNVWGRVGKNKIFMGDSGSLFLGYVISYLCIKYQMDDRYIFFDEGALLTSFTLVIIPSFDVIRVAISRRLRGIDMFTPDKTHIHHLFLAMGLNMHQTLISILCLFLAFCGLNYLLFQMEISLEWIILSDIASYSLTIFITKLLKKQN